MLRSIDLYLLNTLDTLTTKLQRRGWLLTEAYVYVAALVLVSQCTVLIYLQWRGSALMAGIILGTWLAGSCRWASSYRSYPESAKMQQRLNADALAAREREMWVRAVFWWLCLGLGFPSTVAAIIVGDYQGAVFRLMADLSILTMYYLHGCFYLGPGEFGKQKREIWSGDTATDSVR